MRITDLTDIAKPPRPSGLPDRISIYGARKDQRVTNHAPGFSYSNEEHQATDWNHCFLCGVDLTDENRSDEHVFPKWLLRRFDIWNEVLNLPNGTGIRYKHLTIPCCRDCNSVWLSQVENKMATATAKGIDEVRALGSSFIATWMAKLYYGLLFRDLNLLIDRANPDAGTIIDSETIKGFREIHQVLQVTNGRVHIQEDRTPASIFLFSTLEAEEHPKAGFDYADLLHPPFMAIRLGGIGIVAPLLDWGASNAHEHKHLKNIDQIQLHPVQFREVMAYLASVHARFNRNPKYFVGAGNGGADQLLVLPLGGMSAKPLYDGFEPDVYAAYLATWTDHELEDVWDGSSSHWTFLKDRNGDPIQIESVYHQLRANARNR